jgi:acyl-CoA thioesterase FadM
MDPGFGQDHLVPGLDTRYRSAGLPDRILWQCASGFAMVPNEHRAIRDDTSEVGMPRVQMKPLPDYSFACEMFVRTTDLNYGGHLGNDRLLALIHEARVAFLASHGLTELDCGGTSLIMGDTVIMFQSEAFAGDVLRFEVAAAEPSRAGFRLHYRVTRPSDGAAIALVENGMVAFDYETRRIRPLPEAVHAVCVTAE